MRKFTSTRSALLAIVGVLCISAAAVAYWTSSGSGSGTSVTGSDTPGASFSIVDQAIQGPALVPGGPSGTVTADVKNVAANLASLAPQQVVATITGTTQAGCDATDYSFVTAGNWTSTGDVATYSFPAHTNLDAGEEAPITPLTIKMDNKENANQDACKGATVNIAYAVS